MTDEIPQIILNFEDFLSELGFVRLKDAISVSTMGYYIAEFEGKGIHIKIERDRGFWDIRILDMGTNPQRWYNISSFSYLFGEKKPSQYDYSRSDIIC